jgi:hypothetical protein
MTQTTSAEKLLQSGLTEGSPNRHPGQGTANRRFFFDNAMLELVWVENVQEARNPDALPLRLAERWLRRSVSASPFGICVRPSDEHGCVPPFQSYEYRPSFFPAGLVAHICQNTTLAKPLWFFINLPRKPQSLPSRHRIGFERITAITITVPGTPSPMTSNLAAACDIGISVGAMHHLRISFDGARNARSYNFAPELPVEFCW